MIENVYKRQEERLQTAGKTFINGKKNVYNSGKKTFIDGRKNGYKQRENVYKR